MANIENADELLDKYENRLSRKVLESVNDIPSEWTNTVRIPVQQRLEEVYSFMHEVRRELQNERKEAGNTFDTPADLLGEIRRQDWVVAVHNDYHQEGQFRTFWLFTHPNGKYLKGEGETDTDALKIVWERGKTHGGLE